MCSEIDGRDRRDLGAPDRCSLICILCAEPFDDRAWLFELKLNAESFGREMG
jgi:hypothetical protein